jgi:hypothetical protein
VRDEDFQGVATLGALQPGIMKNVIQNHVFSQRFNIPNCNLELFILGSHDAAEHD